MQYHYVLAIGTLHYELLTRKSRKIFSKNISFQINMTDSDTISLCFFSLLLQPPFYYLDIFKNSMLGLCLLMLTPQKGNQQRSCPELTENQGIFPTILFTKFTFPVFCYGVFTLARTESGTVNKWVGWSCVDAFTLHLNWYRNRAETYCPHVFLTRFLFLPQSQFCSV